MFKVILCFCTKLFICALFTRIHPKQQANYLNGKSHHYNSLHPYCKSANAFWTIFDTQPCKGYGPHFNGTPEIPVELVPFVCEIFVPFYGFAYTI